MDIDKSGCNPASGSVYDDHSGRGFQTGSDGRYLSVMQKNAACSAAAESVKDRGICQEGVGAWQRTVGARVRVGRGLRDRILRDRDRKGDRQKG
jgi:hypothetical protein